jgi:aminoglycoside phosphotransferase (APT) family kinase protein
MEKVEGQVPADQPPYSQSGWLFDAAPEQRRRLWRNAVEAMVKVQQVAPEKVDFLDQPARGKTGLEQYLQYNLESFEWAAGGKSHPVLEAAREWLVANLPENRPTSFAWGDARIGNILFHDFEVAAVLDWDMMSLGGGETDLAWWILFDHASSLAYGFEPLEGLGSADETVDLWEELSGRKAQDIEYHLVFAAFRMALALMRVAQILRESGGMPPEMADQMEMHNQGIQYVASMLNLDLPFPATVTWPGLRRGA